MCYFHADFKAMQIDSETHYKDNNIFNIKYAAAEHQQLTISCKFCIFISLLFVVSGLKNKASFTSNI